MQYVQILVSNSSYHGSEALTYKSLQRLRVGQLVSASLRDKQVLGIVSAIVAAPDFSVKEVTPIPGDKILPHQELSLLKWLQAYYPAPLGITTQLFLPKNIPKSYQDLEFKDHIEAPLPPLTAEQISALKNIAPTGVSLLHGETGSGKTRIYIELTKKSLAQKKSALILTPEIGLTSQLAQSFGDIFGDRVVVLHSQQSDVVRQKLWMAILGASQPVVLIGPRSALFAPVRNPGLIVVDEAHEAAYKQDQAPHYLTTRVASKLSELHNCPVIFGSATPSIVDYYLAEQKNRPIVRMQQTARSILPDQKTKIRIVDLKQKTEFSRNPFISDKLIKAVEKTLANKGQVLLFLNRRGTARIVFCENCGWQATCPHCDLPMVYHGDAHQIRCHTCEFKMPTPSNCPECNQLTVVFRSIGTKAVAEHAAKLFPNAKIQRFDTDNKRAERLEQHYEKIKKGEIDIIIGTQTLAKGLDLPKLELIGLIVADTSLYFPDFSAQERTYQLITQILGRIGRGHRSGEAIIQTYSPDGSILQAILAKDWSRFYAQELKERELFMFPPFCYLLKLTCIRASQASAEKAASSFARNLSQKGLKISVDGPTPAFHEKIGNKYHWQLAIKSKNRTALLNVIKALPSGWSYDIDPVNLL